MSEDKENLIQSILEQSLESKEFYNNYMNKLFSELNIYYSYPNIPKENNDKLIENIQKNVNILIKYIDDLKENNKENQDLYRCLSCIFGSFLGDAIGAYCEFKSASPDNINYIMQGNPMFGDSPGQVTDDSEMAMSSAFGIMDNPDMLKLNSDYLYYYYGCWYISHPRDVGFTTRNALSIFNINDFDPNNKNNYTNNFISIKNTNYSSLANGFLMRTSPFIVWCYYRFKKLIQEIFNNPEKEKLLELFQIIKIQAKKDNICTHPNDELCISHSCFCIMSLAAICGYNADKILDIEENLLSNDYFDQDGVKNVKKMIMDEIIRHKKDKKENEDINDGLTQIEKGYKYFTKDRSVVKHMGFYVHAFRLTIYYLSYFDEIEEESNCTKYRKIMNQICTYGGDTDTNAAIVGAVIGPLIGYKNFGDDDFKKMIGLVPKNRYIFSPSFMILYVFFLKESNNDGKIKNKMNFLRMILNVSYGEIDLQKLIKINSENQENNNNTKEQIEREENEEKKEEKKKETMETDNDKKMKEEKMEEVKNKNEKEGEDKKAGEAEEVKDKTENEEREEEEEEEKAEK